MKDPALSVLPLRIVWLFQYLFMLYSVIHILSRQFLVLCENFFVACRAPENYLIFILFCDIILFEVSDVVGPGAAMRETIVRLFLAWSGLSIFA